MAKHSRIRLDDDETTSPPASPLAPAIGHNGGLPLSPIAADRLDGAGEIAEVWFGQNTEDTRKRVYYLHGRGLLPVAKFGQQLVASRKRLEAHYEKMFGGAAD
jgi:hypothetical protein